MKINKAKLLVGTLAVAAVAATVGSISGTVAWFQYSTRSTMSYQGAVAHGTESLQIRLYQAAKDAVDAVPAQGEPGTEGYTPATPAVAAVQEHYSAWKTSLAASDIASFLENEKVRGATASNTLTPVTSGTLNQDAVASDLYRNPIKGYERTADWSKANNKVDYIELPLQFRVLDIDGNNSTEGASRTYLAKKVYLSDITLAAKLDTWDMTKALRVSVKSGDGENDFKQTFSSDGAAVKVGGKLDLDNDGQYDSIGTLGDDTNKPDYSWLTDVDGGALRDATYGDYTGANPNEAKSQSIATKATASTAAKALIANDADPQNIIGKELLTTKSATGTDEALANQDWGTITIRIYLEGWTPLDALKAANNANSAASQNPVIWDAFKALKDNGDKKAAQFFAGLQFTAEAHSNH